MNPRDDHGWRIPRRHTLSWHIYRLTKLGWSGVKIARVTGVNESTVRVLQWKFRKPEASNRRNAYYSRKAYERKMAA